MTSLLPGSSASRTAPGGGVIHIAVLADAEDLRRLRLIAPLGREDEFDVRPFDDFHGRIRWWFIRDQRLRIRGPNNVRQVVH